MKNHNPFLQLSKGEFCLWMSSNIVVFVAFFASTSNDYLSLIASLIGVTALIFVAKGYVIGQVLTVVFAVLYGIISFYFRYYGEMITYLGMTSPIAIMTVIEWIRHPYRGSKEVEVSRMNKRQIWVMWALALSVTGMFYFVLKGLGTANLFFSTVSVTTSFLASYLTMKRSAYYAIGYAANDVVLIILWVLASTEDPAYVPMVVCFVMFFVNDAYGFVNWRRMQTRQQRGSDIS